MGVLVQFHSPLTKKCAQNPVRISKPEQNTLVIPFDAAYLGGQYTFMFCVRGLSYP